MPRDALHQEQIIQAAIALLDEGGIESLTMRRLGSRLGITAAALYWHIKSRHDLLLLAADTVWGQTPLPALEGLEWRPALLAMADNLRSMLLRHPWLLAAMTIQPLDGPARDRHDEHLLAVCEASGLTRRDAEQAAQSVVTFAIGAVLAATLARMCPSDCSRFSTASKPGLSPVPDPTQQKTRHRRSAGWSWCWFSLQANTKTLEGTQHPDHDAHF